MMCRWPPLLTFLLTLFAPTFGISNNHIFHWETSHGTCHFLPSQLGQSPSVHCVDLPYYEYVKLHLPNATGYRHKVLSAIQDLYRDLAKQRTPFYFDGSATPVHPISIAIPSDLVQRKVPPKKKPFATVIPGQQETYIFRDGGDDADVLRQMERDYHEDMRRSFFGLTFKKEGWDCMRHVEILASGSLPVFTDIADCPHYTLALYPKKLLNVLLHNRALRIQGISKGDNFTLDFDPSRFDAELYYITTLATLQYTRSVLTSEAMAGYVLSTIGINPRSVLYLTPDEVYMGGDYVVDSLLYGLKAVLGDHLVVDYPRRAPIYAGLEHFAEGSFYLSKKAMYGGGFSFGMRMSEVPGIVSRDNLLQQIAGQQFDLVVFAGAHYLTVPEFYDEVCKHYDRARVIMVDGGDYPIPQQRVLDHEACVGHVFSREIA